MTALSLDEARLVERIEPQPMLARVLEWAGINSGTTNLSGLSAMAEHLAKAFSALPGSVELVEPAPVERVGADGALEAVACGLHLLVKVRPGADRRILLTGHMDTVFASDHPFQHCEWVAEATLRGPGTADMKGGIALMLEGLAAFEAMRPSLGYDVVINSDEETGSLSSAALIRTQARGKIAALTYEPSLPTGLMARARPGSGNFSAIVRGRSAHAGRNPQDGRNAIVAAADLALRLAGSAHAEMLVNPARIDGGGPNNVVPELAVLRFNIRPRRPENTQEARDVIDSIIAAVAAEHEVAIHLHGGFSRPPKPVTPEGEKLFGLIVGAAADLGQALDWADSGGVCDGNNIAACGVPAIDSMGARGGNIHSPEEFLLADSLEERARLTALVLHRLDRGGGWP